MNTVEEGLSWRSNKINDGQNQARQKSLLREEWRAIQNSQRSSYCSVP